MTQIPVRCPNCSGEMFVQATHLNTQTKCIFCACSFLPAECVDFEPLPAPKASARNSQPIPVKKLEQTTAGKGCGIGCLVIIAIIAAISAFAYIDQERKTPEELRKQRIEKQFSAWDGSHSGVTELIKKSMNDPNSYEHVKTVYVDRVDHLIVTTTFRGKNAFGGIVQNSVTAKVGLDGNVLEIVDPEKEEERARLAPERDARREQERVAAEKEKADKEAAETKRAEELVAEQAKNEAEEMMNKQGLSENDKRYIRGYVKHGGVWVLSPDVSKPSLNVGKPLRNGDMGVPYYSAGSSSTSSRMSVTWIINSDEMVISSGNLWIKGVSTAGLTDRSTIDLEGAFFVDGTKTYTTSAGKSITVPCLVRIDVTKIKVALASETVKKWMSGETKHR